MRFACKKVGNKQIYNNRKYEIGLGKSWKQTNVWPQKYGICLEKSWIQEIHDHKNMGLAWTELKTNKHITKKNTISLGKNWNKQNGCGDDGGNGDYDGDGDGDGDGDDVVCSLIDVDAK